ncbi:MAG: DUF1080 domain-containing protein [Planctomycetaceae bacterium]|nr:DUF1080 domain-containing protein [Planctomycetaceae bacterium]
MSFVSMIVRWSIFGLVCGSGLISDLAAQQPSLESVVTDVRAAVSQDWQRGWIQLFDRTTTFGWRGINPSSIKDGKFELRAGDAPRTSAQFGGFALHLRYQLDPGGQAELRLLANPEGRAANVDHLSLPLKPEYPQLVVQVEPPAPSQSNSTIRFLFLNATGQADTEPQQVEVALGRGYLGFRVAAGTLLVEQISVLPLLPTSEQFKSLTAGAGFDSSGLANARAEMNAEGLALRGGPGYLATTASFGDFILSVEARTQAGTNSGVFFRCIPGENLNGYESQIHNGFVENDRSRPEDCGTGGIFRRVDARRVVADNGQWFRKVMVVCGGQISVWVNGYQVTDWSDQRQPHENPRRGRRLEAGPIMLQAHDPGTQVDFRNFQISELPAR